MNEGWTFEISLPCKRNNFRNKQQRVQCHHQLQMLEHNSNNNTHHDQRERLGCFFEQRTLPKILVFS